MFAKNSDRINIQVAGSTTDSPTVDLTENANVLSLTEEETIFLNSKLIELSGSKIVEGTVKLKEVTSHDKTSFFHSKYYIRCNKDLSLRVDAGTDGRVNQFAKHYCTHKKQKPTKETQKSIDAFVKKRTWEETLEQEFPPQGADDDVIFLEPPSSKTARQLPENWGPDLGMEM